jgi:putative ABC transport system ATP-binding protein
MPEVASEILSISNLSLSFSEKEVFNNFNLNLKENEKIILSGESGSGKSSLLKTILGFVKPVSGKILFENQEITEQNIWQIRKEIAFVPQEINLGNGNIKEKIFEIRAFSHNKKIGIEFNKIYDYLKTFNLPDKILNSGFEEISGGEKQRIALAIALLLDRKLYLFDEITSALDNENKKLVIDFITNEFDKPAIIVAHEKEWLELKNLKHIKIG